MLREVLEKIKKADGDEEGGTTDIPLSEVMQYFLENPNPDDETWHEFAESKGWNVPSAEAAAYRLATIASHFIPKGKAIEKGFTEEDADPEQLAMGIEVEYEHTDSEEMAKRIALDHLVELPDYYTRLKKMEDEGKKELGLDKEGELDSLKKHAQLMLAGLEK